MARLISIKKVIFIFYHRQSQRSASLSTRVLVSERTISQGWNNRKRKNRERKRARDKVERNDGVWGARKNKQREGDEKGAWTG